MNAVHAVWGRAMSRKVRDERLESKAARLALKPRREPYWRSIQMGRAIGYRRLVGGKAGTWIARYYDEGVRQYQALGSADDALDAEHGGGLTYAAAQEAAWAWFGEMERAAGRRVEPITVEDACDLYVADYLGRGGKAEADVRATIAAHIVPTLGRKVVSDLTHADLRAWLHGIATAPARLRTGAEAKRPNVRKAATADAKRARRASANRVLTVLKAMLNFAFREGRVASDHAWRRVKPFPGADAPRIRYLSDDETLRLVNACTPAFRTLVQAALLTGMRYGELVVLRVADLDLAARVLHVREAKAGKPRVVHLGDEAVRLFEAQAIGKPGGALVLPREDGTAWGESHQHRPLRDACAAAKIAPPLGFHGLRHTFASRLAGRGVPMAVIAAALGNSEAICARHYAHLSPTYVADTIREATASIGIVPATPAAAVPIRGAR